MKRQQDIDYKSKKYTNYTKQTNGNTTEVPDIFLYRKDKELILYFLIRFKKNLHQKKLKKHKNE